MMPGVGILFKVGQENLLIFEKKDFALIETQGLFFKKKKTEQMFNPQKCDRLYVYVV